MKSSPNLRKTRQGCIIALGVLGLTTIASGALPQERHVEVERAAGCNPAFIERGVNGERDYQRCGGGGDHTLPTGTIVINGGATYTSIMAVTLTLSATDNSGQVTYMKFSNDNVTYTAQEPYATTRAWTLLSGDGGKIVYVKYRDAAGNWSQAFSDTIILDTTPPVVQITDPVHGHIFGAAE